MERTYGMFNFKIWQYCFIKTQYTKSAVAIMKPARVVEKPLLLLVCWYANEIQMAFLTHVILPHSALQFSPVKKDIVISATNIRF